MYWILTTLLWAQEPQQKTTIYVAPPTISEPKLANYQPYLNSVIVSATHTNSHWVKRTRQSETVLVYDTHTIGYALDTTCDYSRPLDCADDNVHWVLITDIVVTPQFATIIVKLYDENIQLIATSSKSSYGIQECKSEVRTTTIEKGATKSSPKTKITETLPEKCVTLKPSVLDKDIKQAITILFASIHPL